jgi:hypothetical protein
METNPAGYPPHLFELGTETCVAPACLAVAGVPPVQV